MVLAGFELGWVIGAGRSYRANTWTPGSGSLTPVVCEGFTQSEQGNEDLEDYNIAERGTSVTAASLGFLSAAWTRPMSPHPSQSCLQAEGISPVQLNLLCPP